MSGEQDLEERYKEALAEVLLDVARVSDAYREMFKARLMERNTIQTLQTRLAWRACEWILTFGD